MSKHRRPTRTDRLLLWGKDRLTLRRRPQPVLETADFEVSIAELLHEGEAMLLANEDRLDERAETYGPREMYGPMRADDKNWWLDWMEREGIKTPEEAYEVLAARDELESVGEVVRDWERDL